MSFQLQSNIGVITAQMRRRDKLLVAKTTFRVEAEIKVSMSGSKSGRTYGSHQASAPGEAPAIDTGAYVNAIQSEVDGLSGIVGTNQEQALVLEFGGSKMASRPHFGPAFEKAKPEFEAGLKELMK